MNGDTPMSWKFNPPPGWPAQPEGWVPPPGWTPDPNWPPPPAGWQFWVAADASPAPPFSAGPPPQAAPPPAAPPPAAAAPTMMASGAPPFSSGPPPAFSAGPGGPFSSAPPGQFSAAPGGASPYGAVARPRKPWFGQWWGILGLVALLLLGAAIGYGATRVALDASEDDTALGPAVTAYAPSDTPDDSDRGAPR
jgi:hypothetical protein